MKAQKKDNEITQKEDNKIKKNVIKKQKTGKLILGAIGLGIIGTSMGVTTATLMKKDRTPIIKIDNKDLQSQLTKVIKENAENKEHLKNINIILEAGRKLFEDSRKNTTKNVIEATAKFTKLIKDKIKLTKGEFKKTLEGIFKSFGLEKTFTAKFNKSERDALEQNWKKAEIKILTTIEKNEEEIKSLKTFIKDKENVGLVKSLSPKKLEQFKQLIKAKNSEASDNSSQISNMRFLAKRNLNIDDSRLDEIIESYIKLNKSTSNK